MKHFTTLKFRLLIAFLFSASLLFKVSAQSNPIVVENQKTGNPASEWDIDGAGDLSIQGFATDISVNKGTTVHFKIKTDADAYTVTIYRLGYYSGAGARKVGTATITASLPQDQPDDLYDEATGRTDCSNWTESASWAVPSDAVSGIYVARLKRTDNNGASHILFIVRDDASHSDLFFQTSDATWQAYNGYGGNSLYVDNNGIPNFNHAVKVSYNRPFYTRAGGGGGGAMEDGPFNAEYPMIRFLERNGYNVTYTTNVDGDRRGDLIKNHKVFMSVGHDEYWSAGLRASVEAARDAGVHLAFFSGNEVYWKTRWEDNHRTLVCYKEGNAGENTCGGKCDPLPNVWTGTWRGGCDMTTADGCRPENALSGQISWIETDYSAIEVPAAYKNLRLWRNTSIATLGAGQTATFAAGTLGYEWDWEQTQYAASYPAGRVTLSSTTIDGRTHKLSLYRHSSGALVFGAGTVQWSWGLDGEHDRGNEPPSRDMQQFTINLLAEMGALPGTIMNGVNVVQSGDAQSPNSAITAPATGTSLPAHTPVTITGTSAEAGGGVVAGVEVSTDGGTTWKAATGTTSWSFTWTPTTTGAVTIKVRAFDDLGNLETPGNAPADNAITVTVTQAPPPACPCTIFQPADGPTTGKDNDNTAIELGVKFRSTQDGFITGIRFYKASGATGTFIGSLWNSAGDNLAQATFTNVTASGWQEVRFDNPVAITAGSTYIASYHSSSGDYVVTNPYFTTAVENGYLRALADGEDGNNGVYRYTATPAFPNSNFETSNYWVDAIFETEVGPDNTAPVVVATVPASNATNVSITANITASFNEALDAATVTGSTVQLRDAGNNLVSAVVSYNTGNRQIVINPNASLAYNTKYTVTLQGGISGSVLKDLAGNALTADKTWSFTTASPPPPPPTEGPGGSILVISAAANPFSRYPVEILRAQGLNEFKAMDISQVTTTEINKYDVVILGEQPLNATQVAMLTAWTTAGGTLIAFKPDADLAPLLGLTPAAGTDLADKYLKIVTGSGPTQGIVTSTIQYHGPADLYTLNGATALAMLYTTATAATTYPAVTTHPVGTAGGSAIAFTYDLAKSIVYTRQGNPAWSGQRRDGQEGPTRSDNLFFGGTEPDYVDFSKIEIPQADEQQHLLTNIILQGNMHKKPLPRFWFLPSGHKAAVVMSGDDHASGGSKNRFDHYLTQSNANDATAVADWKAIRGTSYIFPNTPITNTEAAAYEAQGFEIALHTNTNCADVTLESYEAFIVDQLAQFNEKYTGVPAPTTNRNHCITWSDWATVAKIESKYGIRLDVNYYYWPASWVQNRAGLFTGSGMPMRFADLDGTIIDNYQVATQMPDESGLNYGSFIKTLIDNATGAKGYYGVFCANMHTDFLQESLDGSDAIVNYAKSKQIPVVTARQMLTWLDGRNNSSFDVTGWDGNQLQFTITAASGSRNIQAMVPTFVNGKKLIRVTKNGATIAHTSQMVKGMDYGFFAASSGDFVAIYDVVAECTPPTGTITAVDATICPGDNVALKLSQATGQSPYTLVVNGTTYTGVEVGSTFATLSTNATETSIWGATGTPANANGNDGQAIEVGVKFQSSIAGFITGVRFYKGEQNTGQHIGRLYKADGSLLASATFTNETPSGWQEVRFDNPVAITAGTTYIASYYSPGGYFSITPGGLADAVTNESLTALASGTEGPNGVFKYGGGFPDGGNTANYWADVLFTQGTPNTAFTLTSITDAGDCNNTNEQGLSVANVTINPQPAGTLSQSGQVCQGAEIKLKFTASAGTAPFKLVINNQTFTNVANNGTISTGVIAAESQAHSIWSNNVVGGEPTVQDNAAYDLGVKFRTSVAGKITGIRFYKRSTNTGTHTGTLWSANGTVLATATFTNETPSGWQQVLFNEPVSVTANTTYVASYFAPNGQYAFTPGFFTNHSETNGPLTALASGTDGGNGVFKENGGFPNQSFNDANYWVDVVFTTSESNTFNLTSITDANGCQVTSGNLQSLTVTAGQCSIVPVTFVDFKARVVEPDVHLSWTTQTEADNRGFEVQRSLNGGAWTVIGFVNGSGISNTLLQYSYIDKNVPPGHYQYRLRQVDFDEHFEYSKIAAVVLSGADVYSLEQNYPNPVNNETAIRFTLPHAAHATLRLYDVSGRLVKVLLNNMQERGTHTVRFNANGLSKGVYYYKLQTANFSAVKKLTVQ